MKNSILFTISFVLISLLFPANNLTAQTISGKIIYSNPTGTELKTINGVTFKKDVFEVRVETDDKDSPFNETRGTFELWSVPTGGGDAFIHGVGLLADKDGDTYCTYGSNMKKADNMIIYTKGGTGKFSNIDAIGTATIMIPADTGKEGDCCMQKWEATFKKDN